MAIIQHPRASHKARLHRLIVDYLVRQGLQDTAQAMI